ncbi:MAG: outer membrane lipid asymmetry maintenance protein MlaD, partial [Rickettsiales bacterium]|nr:outer membrane lipid asymmetry maintenance protein MlaD [Rickettsiales bacterium]
VVLVVAAGFLMLVYKLGNVQSDNGYHVTAKFERVDGLVLGSDVRVSGLKVGSVTSLEIDPKTYQAVATFAIKDSISLPKDSTAEVVSEGLLGGKYVALVPGGDDTLLKEGDQIAFTQSSVNIEQLIGKFVFGSAEDKPDHAASDEIF